MSAFALAATSRSPLTCTGTSSARTPHSSTVATGFVAVCESQPEHLLHALADHVLLLKAREGERVLAAADHATLAVADEERRVRRGK